MDKIILTSQELMVLSANVDADTFYGIDDPFEDMTTQEIWAEIPEIMKSAAEKRYVSLGFDDSISIRKDVRELLSLCINCDAYTRIKATKECISKVIYRKEDRFVLLETNLDDLSLEEKEFPEILKEIKNLLPDCPVSFPSEEKKVERELLEKMAKEDEADIIKSLEAVGVSKEIASLISKGLKGKANYISMVTIDLKNGHSCEEAFLKDENKVLALDMDTGLQGEYFIFRWPKDVEEILQKLIKGEEA